MYLCFSIFLVKKQWILIGFGLLLTASLFFFGSTVAVKKTIEIPVASLKTTFSIKSFIDSARQKLPASRVLYLSDLENKVKRGDIITQQIRALNELAIFWKDSVKIFEPYAYYLAESAKLDNSEKSLTFAAQLILAGLRGEQDEGKLNWESEQAIELFEKAIKINPGNDDLKIGLASCYVYGKGRMGGSQQAMKGIQQLLRVVEKDSNNMKAQLVLGAGGLVSGQYDKAIGRLLKVVKAEPRNLEAVAFLADTYAASGDNVNAIKWYLVSKRLANNPQYDKEVDMRMQSLK